MTHAGGVDLEPDAAALGHYRHAAAGADLHGALELQDPAVGGALSLIVTNETNGESGYFPVA